MFYFNKRDGSYRDFANTRRADGLFYRRLDFGAGAPAGRRWAVQVLDRPIPDGAKLAK